MTPACDTADGLFYTHSIKTAVDSDVCSCLVRPPICTGDHDIVREHWCAEDDGNVH